MSQVSNKFIVHGPMFRQILLESFKQLLIIIQAG